MFHRVTPLLVLALAVGACSSDRDAQVAADSAAEQAAAPNPDEAALEQLRAAYVEHYNLHHPAEVAKLFSDSAFMLAADMAVHEGRPELQATLEAEIAGQPTLTLVTKGTKLFGDRAAALGEYSVKSTAGGQESTLAGSYLAMFRRENGEWKIGGLITNLNAAPPEGFKLQPEEKAPPDNGTMKEFIGKYTQAFNASDWAALANMYASDAQVAYSTSPLIQGTAAIRQRYEERFGASAAPHIEIHDVGSMALNEDWTLDGGWFDLQATPASGAFTQDGMYMNLLQRQADGSWKIYWSVVNGYPKPGAAKPAAKPGA